MRITGVRARTERWPIARGGAARGHADRAAILLEITTAAGEVTLGEAAPLPGMSPDTLAEAAADLAAFAARAPFELAPTVAAITALAAGTASPAARFAIETALLAALGAQQGRPIAELLAPGRAVPELPTSVVVDTAEEARRAVAAGATCLKIKVGSDGDLERVIAIAHAAPEVELRLDANRTWPPGRVRERLFALAELPIAYIEEPCVDAHLLLDDALAGPIALALDESLATLSDAAIDRALRAPGLAALILKPTLLGGFARCLALAARARAAGKDAIVTHTLEGPIGNAACVELARALGGTRPVGTRSPPRPPLATLLATPTRATIAAIHAALAARAPIALLHPRLAEAELARQRALVAEATLPAEAAVILFTSGSTGSARGIVLSRAALAAAAAASAAHLGWRDEDRWLLALPMAHAGGLAVVVRCGLAHRPVVLLEGDWDRAQVARLLEDCTLASLVPTQLAALLDDPAWRPPPALRAVLLGGAAASPALLEAAAARGVPFLTSYGLTESFGQLATAPLARAGDPGAPLVPLPGVAITAGTRTVPAPIRVRAPMLATSYLDGAPIAPELVTADLGFLEHGALHVVGRADDVIITGGENVHPAEIEAVLVRIPGVRAACAFGIADPRWGQIVGAVLVVDPGSYDPVRAAAAWTTALPVHARPRELALAAALPLGPSGKVDRRAAARLARTPVRAGT